MKDPYSVLNVSSSASDEEIKKAYRELARKYHPDNYHNNPLADLAQEKMKEINEAYDTIQKQRSHRSAGSQSSGYGGNPYQGGYSYGYQNTGGDPSFLRVRAAIQRGDLNEAEGLLEQLSGNRTAEWYFLRGAVCMRRGWMDEAYRSFDTAVKMDPGNAEYRQAFERFTNAEGAYRPRGFEVYSTGCGGANFCTRLCCAYCLCNSCTACMSSGWYF